MRWCGGVNLKEWAVSQGISYAAARRWHDAGTLPAVAYQAGRMIVIGDPAPAVRGRSPVHARVASAGPEDDLNRRAARVTAWAAAEGLAAGRVVLAARRAACDPWSARGP